MVATAVDYTLFLLLSVVLDFWYLLASLIGLVMGGVTAFILQRNWTFKKKDEKLSSQAIRYITVWATSIFLNTTGLYLIVEFTKMSAIVAKIIVSVIVGIGFNFLMNKHFVFK